MRNIGYYSVLYGRSKDDVVYPIGVNHVNLSLDAIVIPIYFPIFTESNKNNTQYENTSNSVSRH